MSTAEGRAEKSFRSALKGYNYQFPRDFYAHDDYRIEWWYYTGNLADKGGKEYGYQLTFFRVGLDPQKTIKNPSKWAIEQIYFAHMTVTDIDSKEFLFFERVNRKGLGQAGASSDKLLVWNEDWVLSQENGGKHHLVANESNVGLDLWLKPEKELVIHGKEGISKKGDTPGNASHYFSYTRMNTQGKLKIKGKEIIIEGSSWMDHEFSSNQLSPEQIGWDWFSLKLDNFEEIMLYQIRLKDGGVEKNSSGTLVKANGEKIHLSFPNYKISTQGTWTSEITGATYPSSWIIEIPEHSIRLKVLPDVADQELTQLRSIASSYWEGSVTVDGVIDDKNVSGKGYVELVGYQKDLKQELPN